MAPPRRGGVGGGRSPGTPPLDVPRREVLTGRVVILRLALLGLLAALVVPATAVAAPSISGSDADVWNAASPTPTYTIAADGTSGMEWRLDGGHWVGAQSPTVVLAFRAISDGKHVLRVRPDDDGHDHHGETRRRFKVDTVPARIKIREPQPGAVYAQGQSVAARYSCSGAESCLGPVADRQPLPTAAAGPASFVVQAVDGAGNVATARVDYAVAPPPGQIVPLGASPAAPMAPPRLRRAHLMSPAAGRQVRTLRPLLRWRPHARARLYNVQLFLLEGGTARKVLSAFPAGPRLRVPRGKLAFGRRYLWRVWPVVGGRYPRRPIGLSFFDVAQPTRRGL
jgi:hypothetical protein